MRMSAIRWFCCMARSYSLFGEPSGAMRAGQVFTRGLLLATSARTRDAVSRGGSWARRTIGFPAGSQGACERLLSCWRSRKSSGMAKCAAGEVL
jgi:hypothetical protein